MNQKDLILSISQNFPLNQTESQKLLKFILAKITEELKKEKNISFRNFGSFAKESRPAKKVRHPKTGKIIIIPARITVDFNPSAILLKKI